MIQCFPEGEGVPTRGIGAPTYYLENFWSKTAWKRNKLDWEGA